MRLSRYARNQLRRLALTIDDVERVCRHPEMTDVDPEGRPRYIGATAGKRVRVVLAVDKPDLVVTVHERRN